MADYIGSVKVPDTFIAKNSSFVYVSSNKSKIQIKLNLALSEIKKYFDARRTLYNKIIKNQNEYNLGKLPRSGSKVFNHTDIRFTKKQISNSDPMKK